MAEFLAALKRRHIYRVGAACVIVAAAICAGAAAVAQAPGVRAVPDFSSNGTAWEGPGGGDADFIAVAGSPPLVGSDPAHRYISNDTSRRTGEQPTYRIADLGNPNLTPRAKAIMRQDNDEVLAGKIAYAPVQACTPSGVPAYLAAGGPYFFIQTAEKVFLIEPDEGQARRIRLNVGHAADAKPSWYGDSVGHYEGDTLVVDTIGLNARTLVDNYRTPHSEKLHVVERFRMTQRGNVLEVRITVEDPETYYQPWQAMLRFSRVQAALSEEICREGNFTLFNYGIPIDEEPDF